MTTMVKQSPLSELDSMERRMRRLFDTIGFTPVLLPATDIYETSDEFVVELELPGYEEQELAIDVFDHTVSIKGEHKEEKDDKEKSFHLRERFEREFERRFEFPPSADTEHIRAVFDKGVLELHAPKLAVAKPQRVAITK